MSTYKPRSKSELNKDARVYLNGLLAREKADLNKAEIQFLEARRMYLTAEQLEHYGIKQPKMEKVPKTAAPANDDDESDMDDEESAGDEGEDEDEDGEISEDEEGDEPSEDDDESLANAPDGADLDPNTGKPLKKPAGRAGGKKKVTA